MDREEFLKYTFEMINSDLKFAETKNTFLATANLAIIGWGVSFIFSSEANISVMGKRCFIVFIVLVVVAALVSILSFFPAPTLKKATKTKQDAEVRFMFYKYNRNKHGVDASGFEEEIKNYFNHEEYTPVEKQLTRQIVDLSNIVYFKCECFFVALLIELFSFLIIILFFCIN